MKVPYVKAINDALKEEMRRDGRIVVYGEDPPPWAQPLPACGPVWS